MSNEAKTTGKPSPKVEERYCRVCGTAFEVDLSKRGRRAEFCEQTCRDFEALRGRLEAHAYKIANRVRPAGAATSVVTDRQATALRQVRGDCSAIAAHFNRIPMPEKVREAMRIKREAKKAEKLKEQNA